MIYYILFTTIYKVIYPVLVIGIELCLIGLFVDINYLTMVAIGTVEFLE